MSENDPLLTPGQVAERLQVTEHTIYEWLRAGILHGSKLGRLWRVPESDLERFLHERRNVARQRERAEGEPK